MSDGTEYEIFVQRLQQALLDSEPITQQKNIVVERTKKIIDRAGNTREFDLYWEYELAGVTYKTVIECKDYATPISLEKIDALIGKIHDIPDLKPVFATKTGYQKGAKNKAESNGIELLIVREQRLDDWEDRIREINVHLHIEVSTRITRFRPVIDGNWLKKNSGLQQDNIDNRFGLNTETFVDDLAKNESYSLYELACRLDTLESGYGQFTHSESFKNAYLRGNGLKLKIVSYEVEYCRSPPIETTLNIDASKELVGVIEYLSRGSRTAIFRDKIVTDWK